MQRAALTTFAIGAVILLAGAVMLVMAGPSAGHVYIDPEEKAVWRAYAANQTTLPFLHNEAESRDYALFARRGYIVENLTVVDESGTELLWMHTYCSAPNHQKDEDCQSEWVVIAEFGSDRCPCIITFNTTGEVLIVPNGEAGSQSLADEWTAQLCGGIMTLCLGVILLVVGGGLARSSKNRVVEFQPPAPAG